MSHFAQNYPSATSQAALGLNVASTRVDFGTGVRGAVSAPVTQTTAGFVVPALGGSVTINVLSTANFVVGDLVMIGTRAAILSSQSHSTSGPGTLIFSGRYMQGRAPGAAIASGLHLIGPAGQATTITAGIGSLPDWINVTSATLTIADRAQVPSNSYVKLTNYAGVFRVSSIPGATSLQLTCVVQGDLPAGATCIQDTSASDAGAYVTQFNMVGVVPKGMIFTMMDAWLTVVSVSGASASTPAISLGFIPNPYTSGPTNRMSEFVDNSGQFSGTSAVVNDVFPVQGKNTDASADRIAPMDGMAYGVRVVTPTSTSHVHNVSVVGLLTPIT